MLHQQDMTESDNASAVENICNVVGDNHTNLDGNDCKAVEIPSERDLRELNRSYHKIVNVFCNISHDTIEFEKLTEVFTQLTENYHCLYTGLELFVSSIKSNEEKVDEYRDKIISIDTQYKLMKRTFENAKREHDRESLKLVSDLQVTAKKNIRSKKSSRCSSSISTKLTSKSSILSYRGLSPKQRAMVAESKLRMIEIENEGKLRAAEIELRAAEIELRAAEIENEGRLQAAKIEATLAKKLAEPDNYSSAEEPEVVVTHGCSNKKHSMGNHIEYDDADINDASVPHDVVHGGSSKHGVNVDHNTEGVNSTAVGQGIQPCRPTSYQMNDVDCCPKNTGYGVIGDSYLAGKVLIESGTKVQFDGNPKNYITFRQGMDRVLSIHGSQYGLVYDILQSRCTGKATEAIRFCDRIQDPELAVNTALERLKKYFGDETAVVEAHVASVTKGEAVKWTIDSFQSFLNELEDIKLLLCDDSKKSIMNSPGVIKGIIARLPKRTRDKFVEVLCKSNQHLPKFQFLLEFVQEQLKLVSHPLMQDNTFDAYSKTVKSNRMKYGTKRTTNKSNQVEINAYSQRVDLSTCVVIGCNKKCAHQLWACDKFASLTRRDKWSIAKREKCCYKCLGNDHKRTECKSKYCCKICKSCDHHYLLCPDNVEKAVEENQSNQQAFTVNCCTTDDKGNKSSLIKSHNVVYDENMKLLPVLPITVSNIVTGKNVVVNCLLDTGCDTTMVTTRLANMLKIEIESTTCVQIATANGNTMHNAAKIDIRVGGVSNVDRYLLKDVICVDNVATHKNPVKCDMIKLIDIAQLDDVNLSVVENKNIDVLIGIDHDELLDVTEIRRSSHYKLAAKLTKLGWVLVGHMQPCVEQNIENNQSITSVECESIHANLCSISASDDMFDVPSLVCNGDANSCELLHAQIKHYYYDEFNINADDEDNAPSVDDIKCLNIYESSITKEEGRYYLKLPFKNDAVKLPNNKTQAESRLLQQRK